MQRRRYPPISRLNNPWRRKETTSASLSRPWTFIFIWEREKKKHINVYSSWVAFSSPNLQLVFSPHFSFFYMSDSYAAELIETTYHTRSRWKHVQLNWYECVRDEAEQPMRPREYTPTHTPPRLHTHTHTHANTPTESWAIELLGVLHFPTIRPRNKQIEKKSI